MSHIKSKMNRERREREKAETEETETPRRRAIKTEPGSRSRR